MIAEVDPGHIPSDEMSQLISGAMERASRERLYSHLASCPECRSEAVAVRRILDAHGRGRVGRRVLVVAAGLAAILALVVQVRDAPRQAPEVRTRSGVHPPPEVIRLVPVAPEGDLQGPVGPLAFVWRPVGGAVEFRLTVTDQDGKTLWTKGTTDTTLVRPLELSLVRGVSYYWFVDALLPNGESVTTGTREFRIIR